MLRLINPCTFKLNIMPSVLAFHRIDFCFNCFLDELPISTSVFPYFSLAEMRFKSLSFFDIFDQEVDKAGKGFTPHLIDISRREGEIIEYKKYCCFCKIKVILKPDLTVDYEVLEGETICTNRETWKKLFNSRIFFKI